MRTEANVEEQAKVVHNLQRIRDGSIEESRSRLKQEEQIFFTAATVIGATFWSPSCSPSPGGNELFDG